VAAAAINSNPYTVAVRGEQHAYYYQNSTVPQKAFIEARIPTSMQD
jgi:hypothetical protein